MDRVAGFELNGLKRGALIEKVALLIHFVGPERCFGGAVADRKIQREGSAIRRKLEATNLSESITKTAGNDAREYWRRLRLIEKKLVSAQTVCLIGPIKSERRLHLVVSEFDADIVHVQLQALRLDRKSVV